jgi:hypothetical protein
MRIVRLAAIPVVVRIRRRDEVTVVVPSNLSTYDVLAVARLVLSGEEFAELAAASGHAPGGDGPPPLARTMKPRAS